MKEIDNPVIPSFSEKTPSISATPWHPAILKDGVLKVEGLFYQMYDHNDYEHYLDNYLRARYG